MASTLKRSADRKVTTAVSPNGKRPTVANAFGIPAGITCPGATAVCRDVCYAGALERVYRGVRDVLTHNFTALQDAGTVGAMASLLSEMVREFVADSVKRDAPLRFRIHWDGDFYSTDYAMAWRAVIDSYRNVEFWVYTRSFHGTVNVLPILSDLPNLKLYLSVDRENISAAVKARREFPSALWAYLGDTFADGMAATSGKRYACPENRGSLPLISAKGSACMRCGICPDGRGDVLFSVGKR